MDNVFAGLDQGLDERCLADACLASACQQVVIYPSVTTLHIPESPATSTLSLPIRLPPSVNGRRLGILIEGMTSWGALPLSIMSEVSIASRSWLKLRAWLAMSSENDALIASLMADGDPGVASIKGVIGWERLLVGSGKLSLLGAVSDIKEISSASAGSSVEMDSRSLCAVCLAGLLGSASADPALR